MNEIVLTGKALQVEEYLSRQGKDPETVAVGHPVPIAYLLPSVRRRTDERRYGIRALEGIPTGIPALDIAFRGGYQNSFYYIWMGLQGAGKTNWLLHSTLYAAEHLLQQGPVAGDKPAEVVFFELEMSARELLERLAAMKSGVSSMEIALGGRYDQSGKLLGRLTDGEYDDWYAALDYVSGLPIRVEEGAISAKDVADRVHEVECGSLKSADKKRHVGLVVVDYLQILVGEGDKYESVSKSTNDLRQVALLSNKPVLTACQANRTVHNADGKRIEAHMAKGTSDIESSATHLVAWNNYAMLLPRDEQPDDVADGDFDILKNRTGWRTVVPVQMRVQTGLFVPAPSPVTLDEVLGDSGVSQD